jgi:Domain of unknown function (DUF4189)
MRLASEMTYQYRSGELMRLTMSPLRIVAAAVTFAWVAAVPPPALAFGALAVDASPGTRHGAASDQPTVAAARERALAECDGGCTVVITFHRFCAAFAADRTPGSPSWGRAGGSTRAEAEDKAVDYCRLYDGKACHVRVSACDSDAATAGAARFERDPPAMPTGWSSFEQNVAQDQASDYRRTRTRRVDYFHPRDVSVDNLARLVDAFVDFLDSDLIRVPPDRHFKVLISRNRAQHVENIRAFFGDADQPGLVRFYPREDVLATYEPLGPGTVTSLLIYPLLDAHIPHSLEWARTAIVSFFEKVYAYPARHERLVFRVGYHNPPRIQAVAGCLDRLDLTQIISNPNYAAGQSHLRLIGTFLWQHGRFKNFIDRLYDHDLRGRENYVAAAFERPMSEVNVLWRDYLADIPKELYAIDRLPLSQIYSSEEEFEAAMAAANPSWSERILSRVFRWVHPPGCPIKNQSGRSSIYVRGTDVNSSFAAHRTGRADLRHPALRLVSS